MSSIFGGSKSKSSSESYNKNMGVVTSALSPVMGYAGAGGNALQSLLGGDASGFNDYRDALGYDWELGQGLGSIAAQNLSMGLGDSGATLKSLAKYQTGLNNQYLDSYLTGNQNLANLGLNAASQVGNVGQYNKSTSSSKSSPGLGGFLGAGLSAIGTGGLSSLASAGFGSLKGAANDLISSNPGIF